MSEKGKGKGMSNIKIHENVIITFHNECILTTGKESKGQSPLSSLLPCEALAGNRMLQRHFIFHKEAWNSA